MLTFVRGRGTQAIAMGLFTRRLGWTREQVDAHVAECLRDVEEKSNHFYYPM